MTQNISELKVENIELVKNRPAISGFRDKISLGAILEKAYITPEYFQRKYYETCVGIDHIYEKYKDKNVMFIGEAGSGKTSAFLRLYMGAGDSVENHFDRDFFYCYAPDLDWETKTDSKYYSYYRELKKILDRGDGLNGILLLDGLEEAFWDNSEKASKLIRKLGESKITFWVSCRTNYYHRLDAAVDQYFSEIVEVNKWDKGKFERFISLCLKDNNNRDAIKEKIDRVAKQIESFYERPLFATMILFVAEDYDLEDVHTEYELIGLFLNKWIDREKERVKNVGDTNYEDIRDVALNTYLQSEDRPKYRKELRVFRDLLVLTGASRGIIHGFSHREFLVYFIANAMIDAALDHPENIVLWFSQTFYDDITNMIKPVLYRLDKYKSNRIYNNLFSVYKSTYEQADSIEKEFARLGMFPEESFLKLRDEIMYFIFRLRGINHDEFAQYAYAKSQDTMLFLGIAYGMAEIDPSNPYTLEFAKKLIPNSAEDIRNRGWGMCFFGDVEENGYTYDDSEGKPWTKVRKNRLTRLSDNNRKYVTRVLDLPLLYCYYYSRGFADCTSYRDYLTIRDTDITLPCFGEAQRVFMSEQKQKLASRYLEQLLFREITDRSDLLRTLHKEDVEMDAESNKIILKIDDQLAERVLRQIEYREYVLQNLKDFWDKQGKKIIVDYKPLLGKPTNNFINKNEYETRIKECKILIISANSVEGAVVTHRLMKSSGCSKLDAWLYGGFLFQFATIDKIPVVHIWPLDTSSFTQFGSFSAVDKALDEFTPQYVFSVGVAFGVDPKKQLLGDVLISKELVFYDNFNKVTDGKITLNTHDTYRIDENLAAQLHMLDFPHQPEEPGNFKWYYCY